MRTCHLACSACLLITLAKVQTTIPMAAFEVILIIMAVHKRILTWKPRVNWAHRSICTIWSISCTLHIFLLWPTRRIRIDRLHSFIFVISDKAFYKSILYARDIPTEYGPIDCTVLFLSFLTKAFYKNILYVYDIPSEYWLIDCTVLFFLFITKHFVKVYSKYLKP